MKGGLVAALAAVRALRRALVESPDSNWPPEELAEAVAAFDADGFPLHLHAIGDAGVRAALDAIEHAVAVNGPRDRRMVDLTIPRLGPGRAAWQYPIGSLARAGARLSFGSDWPVGKRADLAVLGADVPALAGAELTSVPVTGTWLAGVQVFG